MKTNKYKIIALVATLGMPFLLSATAMDAANLSDQASSTETIWYTNPLLLTLLSLMVLLLLIIMMLGGVLLNLVKLKYQSNNATKSFLALAFLLLAAPALQAQETETAKAVVTSIGGINSNMFYLMVTVIIVELIAIAMITWMVMRLLSKEQARVAAAANQPVADSFLIKLWKKLNDSVEIEKEKDIQLDHNYDGIKELDNNLPPWWKYGFYVSIIWGVIYFIWFHAGGSGLSSAEQYDKEIAEAKKQIEEYQKKSSNMVDENTVTLLTDASDIDAGKVNFEKTCFPCHGKLGEGTQIAPNLTDDYWIHGGGIKNIFKTIKYGVPEKGMKSWKDDFSPKQISQITSYIMSIKGSNPPNAREPQGNLYKEDTTAVPADSSAVTGAPATQL